MRMLGWWIGGMRFRARGFPPAYVAGVLVYSPELCELLCLVGFLPRVAVCMNACPLCVVL